MDHFVMNYIVHIFYFQSEVWMDGDKLIWIQRGKPVDTTITRHIDEDGNTMVEVGTLSFIVMKL